VASAPSPSLDAVLRAHLEKSVDTLTKEFDGIFERDHVRSIVEQSASELAQGQVAEFVPVLAHRFARERLRAQARTEDRVGSDLTEVLFVSLLGGGRAQIAAALLSRAAGDAVSVHTAGSDAGGGIDANVRIAMDEVGIDLSEEFTKPLSPEVLSDADIVVTMGRSVGEVEIPATARQVDWRVGDPAGAELAEVRRVRDDIERRVERLASELLS
jgi:arsenate reductase